jgi:hypothetical protein
MALPLLVSAWVSTGTVLLYIDPASKPPRRHERATHAAVARMLADLKGYDFGGVFAPERVGDGHVFFLPHDTLVAGIAAGLGIRSIADLFGGVVPHEFVKTKAITHELVDPRAAHPDGWSEAFAARVAAVVLPGFTAFTRADAREAGRRLLSDGPVRLKPTRSAGSRGQRVVETPGALDAALGGLTDDDLARWGVVLERNLENVRTYSVGQVTVDDDTASYVGTQGETRDNEGRVAYGGSDLAVIRGSFPALARRPVDPLARRAIAYATVYDRATREFPGFFASRRNYDVCAGTDVRGRRHLGVLESSWRIGGASAAEVVAMRALRDDPRTGVVRVCTVEAYGRDVEIPADAIVHFHGVDEAAGPLARYTRVTDRRAA